MSPCRTTFYFSLSRFSTAIFITATLVLNAMAPTLAHAATQLQGDQVNANALVRDAYIAITYRDSNDQKRMARGWIDALGETSFTIRSGGLKGKTTIAYVKVLSIIMSTESSVPAKQMNEVNRFIRNEQMKAVSVAVMTREEGTPEKIKKGWYAHVVYTSEGVKVTTTGWITAKDAEGIAIYNGEGLKKWKIAYSDIDTLAVAKYRRTVEGWQNLRQAVQLFSNDDPKSGQRFDLRNAKVRFKAPSISKWRIVGKVVEMNRDTLVIELLRTFIPGRQKRIVEVTAATITSQDGRTLYQVPMASISNFEVSIGQHRHTDTGLSVGLILSAGLVTLAAISQVRYVSVGNVAMRACVPLTAVTTLIGVAIKSEKWVEVPPQRLNLSIAPTPEKGLRAALMVNF